MLIKNRSLYMVLDLAAIVLAYLLAMLARFTAVRSYDFLFGQWYGCILVAFSYMVVILLYQPEEGLMERSDWGELRSVLTENLFMALFIALILYLSKTGGKSSRSFYIIFFVFNCLWTYLGRLYSKSLIISFYRKEENRKKLLVCANESNILETMKKLTTTQQQSFDVIAVAIVETAKEDVKRADMELNLIKKGRNGTYMALYQDDITEFLTKQVVDEALLSLPDSNRVFLNEFINRLESLGIVVHVTTDTFGIDESEKKIQMFGDCRVFTYCPRIFETTELALKRLMDIGGGLVGVLMTVVLGIFVAPAIYLESPGPVIFKQTRIGKNGRRFLIYKFRSMYMDAEERKKELMERNEMNGFMFKVKDDPRITRVGKFIRKTSIDEFPQFFNVLKGDMSLVGTRPPTVDEFMHYEERHKRRLSLKPGITGMWQATGRSSIQNFEDVVKLDLEYIDNWSIWLDIKILLQTVLVVLLHKGAE